MSLWRLAWRYAWTRPLVTVLTLAGLALGAALISGVLSLRRETQRAFMQGSASYDLVVGAKGSPLQLVLSSVYHLDVPPGNIPYARYEALRADARVRAAYPIGLGDNFRGFRIVGTEPALLDAQRIEPDEPPVNLFALREGRAFTGAFEAVLGHDVARQAGLAPGDTFTGSHGLVAGIGPDDHAHHPYTVVGVLAPSGRPDDRAIFVPLDAVWRIHAHEEADAREVTAVLVQLKVAGLRLWVADEIQRETEAMAAIPMNEMFRLYRQILGPVQRMLMAAAYLVVTVAALSMLAALYQSAERRRRDLAILRALGAHPGEIFALVMSEAVLLTLMGLAAGWLLGHGAAAVAAHHLQQTTGLALSAWTSDRTEALALLVVAACGCLSGLVPALAGYRRSPVEDIAAT